MNHIALIVIDVQALLIGGKPYQQERFLANINKAIAAFRRQHRPVIFIQHTDAKLAEGSPQAEIYRGLDVQPGDKRFLKRSRSMFYHTELQSHLQDAGIDTLLLCGMQTEYCVDSSLKAAFDLGYKLYVLKEGTSTFDGTLSAAQLQTHYESVWQGLAESIRAEDVSALLQQKE